MMTLEMINIEMKSGIATTKHQEGETNTEMS